MRIGSDDLSAQVDVNSEGTLQSLSSSNMEQNDYVSSEISDKARRIKEIEEYPRPNAVVGVSVL